MNGSQILLLIVTLGVGLTNLACLIYVLTKMFSEKGFVHVLIGFFCCQLYPFVWGWLNAARLGIYDVMIFWSATSVLGIILQFAMRALGLTEQNFSQF